MIEPRAYMKVERAQIEDVKTHILEELNRLFTNGPIYPETIGAIRRTILNIVASDGRHNPHDIAVDIRQDRDDPTMVNITPLNLYTGLVIHGIFDYTSDQVRFLQVVEDVEVLEAGGVCRIDSIVTERGTFKLLVSSDAEILPVFCIEPIKPVTYIDVRLEIPQSPH